MQPTLLFDPTIHQVDPKTLRAAAYNPRVNMQAANPAAFARIKRSLEQGVFKPILVNKRTGNIVAGHQRTEAAIALGYDTVPVLYLDVSEREEKRINIADNADWEGTFNLPMLREVILEIDTGEVDIDLTGLSDSYLEDLMGYVGDPRPEGVEGETASGRKVKAGEVYQLGTHTLTVGKETNEALFLVEDWEKMTKGTATKHG